jgi:hypothetical protein
MRRIALAFVLAVGLGYAATAITAMSECYWLTPDNTFLWWLYGCGADTAGGGGSGAK